MWFEDYDEFMMFKDLCRRAKAYGRTSFEYDNAVYSTDCAMGIINAV